MRRRTIVAIALLLAVAPAIAPAQPQPPPPPAQPAPPIPPGGTPGQPGIPGLGPQLGRILERLNLTAEQRTSITTIVAAHKKTSDNDRQQIIKAREMLVKQVNAATFDEGAIRQAAAAIAALDANRAVDSAKFLKEVRAVLTPEQQKQFQEALTRPPQPQGAVPGGQAPPRARPPGS